MAPAEVLKGEVPKNTLSSGKQSSSLLSSDSVICSSTIGGGEGTDVCLRRFAAVLLGVAGAAGRLLAVAVRLDVRVLERSAKE